MHDILTVAWKEWRELLRMGGTRKRAIYRMIFSVGILGIIWPWQIGAFFVTSRIAVVLAAISAAMYVAGVVPDSFAGERERHTLETLLASRLPDRAILLGKLAALISYGLMAAVIVLAFGWVTVNIVHRSDGILLYKPVTLLAAALFSLLAAGFMGAVGVLVSLRAATVKQAQQILSTAIMIVFFVPVVALPTLPPEWREFFGRLLRAEKTAGLAASFAGGLLIIQLILYVVIAARFKRSRLIL